MAAIESCLLASRRSWPFNLRNVRLHNASLEFFQRITGHFSQNALTRAVVTSPFLFFVGLGLSEPPARSITRGLSLVTPATAAPRARSRPRAERATSVGPGGGRGQRASGRPSSAGWAFSTSQSSSAPSAGHPAFHTL